MLGTLELEKGVSVSLLMVGLGPLGVGIEVDSLRVGVGLPEVVVGILGIGVEVRFGPLQLGVGVEVGVGPLVIGVPVGSGSGVGQFLLFGGCCGGWESPS